MNVLWERERAEQSKNEKAIITLKNREREREGEKRKGSRRETQKETERSKTPHINKHPRDQLVDSAAGRVMPIRSPSAMWCGDGNFYLFEGMLEFTKFLPILICAVSDVFRWFYSVVNRLCKLCCTDCACAVCVCVCMYVCVCVCEKMCVCVCV